MTPGVAKMLLAQQTVARGTPCNAATMDTNMAQYTREGRPLTADDVIALMPGYSYLLYYDPTDGTLIPLFSAASLLARWPDLSHVVGRQQIILNSGIND